MKQTVKALNKLNRAYAVSLLCAATALTLSAQTFTTLHSFSYTDGADPYYGALVQGTDGNLYGTTSDGGANGGGTVFKITPSGTLTTLYDFCSQTVDTECLDGQSPQGGLIQAADGDFYGTTEEGGANADGGTVFKITPSGTLTTLYNFCSQPACTDGAAPLATLVQTANGDFYGTTVTGGANNTCLYGCGTVFKITTSGSLTTLYNFCSQSNCVDGETPYAGLVQAIDGDLYGTTGYGGADGSGTVFRITASGALTSLYSFCGQDGCPDGHTPASPLVQASNGDFYGTTLTGAINNGATLFRITPKGALTTLYRFNSTGSYAALVQATNGDLYGTVTYGGAYHSGMIYKTTPSGTVIKLFSFCGQSGCADGAAPVAGLVQDTNGDLYGTTFVGGAGPSVTCPTGCGTVFRLSAGLQPFVRTQSASGKVGEAVEILGTDLTGATSVTFNGTPAVSIVVSSSGTEITAIVPPGATSGTVRVVVPSGTLSSNTSFRVLP
jgi:uncharacterized repeat protein (TIGR03803 family)